MGEWEEYAYPYSYLEQNQKKGSCLFIPVEAENCSHKDISKKKTANYRLTWYIYQLVSQWQDDSFQPRSMYEFN